MKKKFLVLNHSRKTYHFSTSAFCYREHNRKGKEIATPDEDFEILTGGKAHKINIPKGYKNDL